MMGGPSPKTRPWIVIAILFVIGWLCVAYRVEYDVVFPAEMEGIGGLLVLIAVAIWIVAYREIGLVRQVEALVTTGIYARTRNPVYLAAIIGVIGGALDARRLLAFVWVVVSFLVLYWLARQEERELERAYGEPYVEYKRRVPLLLPRL